jgi:serine/threonine-protein kinase
MDQQQAEGAIRNAWMAGLISGALTLIVTLVAMAGYSFMGFSALNLLDVFVIGGLAFGIYRKSRTCAVIMLVYFIGSKIVMWTESRSFTGIPLAVLFGWYFFQGMRGTFAWHGLNPGAAAAAPQMAPAGAPPKFKTREEYIAWKEQRTQQASVGALSPPAPARAESSAATVWLVSFIVVAGIAGVLLFTDAGQNLVSGTSKAAAWQEFTSPEGNFAVLMPGTPAYEKKGTATAAGSIDMHLFTSEPDRDAAYIVMYSDYPEIVLNVPAQKILDGGRDGAVANSRGRLLGEQELSLDGFPGREFTIDVQGKGLLKARAFLVRQRMYTIIAAGTREKVEQGDTAKFLTSFRMLAR